MQRINILIDEGSLFMAKITRITVQKRNKERYNIFLDSGAGEEYGLSVDQDVLIKCGLKKGAEVNEEELKKVIEEDERKKTYHLALHFLSYRMRSAHELSIYLESKDRLPEHIASVLRTLKEQKLLDDEVFSEAFVNTKKKTTMKGPLKLRQELNQKGISKQTIEGALERFPEKEQINQVVNWLEKQQNRKGKESTSAFKTKLSQSLVGKGYKHSVIEVALSKVAFEENVDEEWEAVVYQGLKLKRKYEKKFDGWEFKQRIKQGLYRKGFSLTLIEKFIEQECQ
jgi:regulatory protein